MATMTPMMMVDKARGSRFNSIWHLSFHEIEIGFIRFPWNVEEAPPNGISAHQALLNRQRLSIRSIYNMLEKEEEEGPFHRLVSGGSIKLPFN